MKVMFRKPKSDQKQETKPKEERVIKTEHTAMINFEHERDKESVHDTLLEIEKLISEGFRVVGYADASYKDRTVLLVKDQDNKA
jgi:hypothetical protein